MSKKPIIIFSRDSKKVKKKCYPCIIGTIITLSFGFSLFSCGTSKTVLSDIKIEQISLYEYFNEGGTTTVGVFKIFDNLQVDNVRTIDIEDSELIKIQTIISTSEKTYLPKWFQYKTGIYLLFFELKDTEGNKRRMYLSYDNAFVDIDNSVHYRIKDEGQKLWIRQFQEKYRGKNLDW